MNAFREGLPDEAELRAQRGTRLIYDSNDWEPCTCHVPDTVSRVQVLELDNEEPAAPGLWEPHPYCPRCHRWLKRKEAV